MSASGGLRSGPGLRQFQRHKFSPEEDDSLRRLVDQFGTHAWEAIRLHLPGRTAKQCRDRYENYLLETLVSHPWSPAEDALLCQKYREIGPHWVQIANFLPGRSGNTVKNRWHKHLATQSFPIPGRGQMPAQKPNEPDKPVINLCEAIGVKECDLAALFTQVSGYWGSFTNGEAFL
jgi:hypothetical protein